MSCFCDVARNGWLNRTADAESDKVEIGKSLGADCGKGTGGTGRWRSVVVA